MKSASRQWYPETQERSPVRIVCFARTAGLVAAVFILLGIVSVLDARVVEAAGTGDFLWILADKPGRARPYQPQSGSTWDAEVIVDRKDRGQYKVLFPYRGRVDGHFQVSAVGGNKKYCNVATAHRRDHFGGIVTTWHSATVQTAEIRCYDRGSNPSDSAFSLQFMAGGRDRAYGVARHNRDLGWPDAGGRFALEDQYNAGGRTNVVDTTLEDADGHYRPGRYVIQFPGIEIDAVAVTAHGFSRARCFVQRTYRDKVFVGCFDHRGAYQESSFAVLVQKRNGDQRLSDLYGISSRCNPLRLGGQGNPLWIDSDDEHFTSRGLGCASIRGRQGPEPYRLSTDLKMRRLSRGTYRLEVRFTGEGNVSDAVTAAGMPAGTPVVTATHANPFGYPYDQLDALDWTPRHCKVSKIRKREGPRSGPRQAWNIVNGPHVMEVDVRCFDGRGRTIDSPFEFSYWMTTEFSEFFVPELPDVEVQPLPNVVDLDLQPQLDPRLFLHDRMVLTR